MKFMKNIKSKWNKFKKNKGNDKKIIKSIEEIKSTIPKILPPGIALVFGEGVTKIVALAGFLGEGFGYFRRKNMIFLNECEQIWMETRILELIDDQTKSAEYIQFLRKIFSMVAYEKREQKRKLLLSIVSNYGKKITAFSFDQKIQFLDIFDRLSVNELLYILYLYGKINLNIEEPSDKVKFYRLKPTLASYGLLQLDLRSFDESFKKIGDSLKYLKEGIKSKEDDFLSVSSHGRLYDPFFDQSKINYKKTRLGINFVDFIFNKDFLKDNLNNLKLEEVYEDETPN